jgi:Domain of unknown function (DUF4399)
VKETARTALLCAALTLLPAAACPQGAPPAPDARLYLIWPQDGATLKSPFRARFGLRNMGVNHAGDDFPNTGHHHLFVDVDEPLDPNETIPQDKKHLHFGAGETEAMIELPPGPHRLQLVLGDANHFPFKPPLASSKITITVVDENDREQRQKDKDRNGNKKH